MQSAWAEIQETATRGHGILRILAHDACSSLPDTRQLQTTGSLSLSA